MIRTLLTSLFCALLLVAPAAFARDSIEASPYGNLFTDLLEAFHAVGAPCEGVATEAAEVCFRSQAVSASYLAERLSEIVQGYDSVGLQSGGWRAANGVWTVSLALPNRAYGYLEIFLAEATDNVVNGVIRLVPPR